MKRNVLVGEFAHETNTFAATGTTREDFRNRRAYYGDTIPRKLRGTNSEIGGAIDVADDSGIDLHWTVAASATPGGRVTTDAYEHFVNEIVAGTRESGDEIDGVLLVLHGAMVPAGMDDGEGPIVERVREIVGDIPIVVTHDLHGNVTDNLVEHTDAIVAYETYPHIDMAETGRRAMGLLNSILRGKSSPVMHVERPPVLAFPPRQNTREGPMAEFMAYARKLEERDDILKASVLPGFHGADVPSTGPSMLVVADDNPVAAREVSRELAKKYWDNREAFVGDYPEPQDAIAYARKTGNEAAGSEGPIVVADTGDNPGGGGVADGTTLLRELIDQNVTNAGIAILCDPEAVDVCAKAGVGGRVEVTLGGKTDDRHGDPIEGIEGHVKSITDGEFVNTGPMATGTENSLGRTVRFQCGVDDSIDVIITEKRLQPFDAEIWRHVGIQPESLDVLVVKSMNHFRADYEPLAKHVIVANSPGLATMDPSRFEYERLSRPCFPIDKMHDDDYPDW